MATVTFSRMSRSLKGVPKNAPEVSLVILLVFSSFAAPGNINAATLSFDGILGTGESIRSVPFVEQSGFTVLGSNDMSLVDESFRSFLSSDALAVRSDGDPFLFSQDSSTFNLSGFAAGASSSGDPISLSLTGSYDSGTSRIFVQQNILISGDANGLANFTPHYLFQEIGFDQVKFDVSVVGTGRALFLDDISVENIPSPDLGFVPSLTGRTMDFDGLLGSGELVRQVQFVEQNEILLLGSRDMSLFDDSRRDFLSSDALGLRPGADPILSLISGGEFKLSTINAVPDTFLGPTELCLSAVDLVIVTQCFLLDSSEPQTLGFADIFDSLSYSSVSFHSISGDIFIDDIRVSPAVVPLPPSIFLFGAALVGLFGFKWKLRS